VADAPIAAASQLVQQVGELAAVLLALARLKGWL
jgi:hypothetical protein